MTTRYAASVKRPLLPQRMGRTPAIGVALVALLVLLGGSSHASARAHRQYCSLYVHGLFVTANARTPCAEARTVAARYRLGADQTIRVWSAKRRRHDAFRCVFYSGGEGGARCRAAGNLVVQLDNQG